MVVTETWPCFFCVKFSQNQDSFAQISLRQRSGDKGICDRKLRAPGHLHLTSAPELCVRCSFLGRLLVNLGSEASLAAACLTPFCSPASPIPMGDRVQEGRSAACAEFSETLKKRDSRSESCPAVVGVLPSCAFIHPAALLWLWQLSKQ